MNLAEQLIDEEEGPSSPHVYLDSRGYQTIARATLVDARIPCDGLCQEARAAQDAHELARAMRLAQLLPGFEDCNDVRQAVLVAMCYQLGGLDDWPEFRAALAAGDYAAAARAGRDSDWWRVETPDRAEREMKMLESGQWVPKQ